MTTLSSRCALFDLVSHPDLQSALRQLLMSNALKEDTLVDCASLVNALIRFGDATTARWAVTIADEFRTAAPAEVTSEAQRKAIELLQMTRLRAYSFIL